MTGGHNNFLDRNKVKYAQMRDTILLLASFCLFPLPIFTHGVTLRCGWVAHVQHEIYKLFKFKLRKASPKDSC